MLLSHEQMTAPRLASLSVLTVAASVLLLCCNTAQADLVVKVDAPKQVGRKVLIKLTMKNTFQERVESARAQIFLLDDQGKVVGQAARWPIGGTKDKPALPPSAETTFNFVIETDKPFTQSKVNFTRVVLEGGKLPDVSKTVQIQNPAK